MNKETELYELFKRFAEGNYTIRDLERIREEVENTTDKKSLVAAIKHHWYQDILTGEESNEEFDFQSCLGRVHQRINQMYNKTIASRETSPLKRLLNRSLNIYYRAAAILLIPLMGISLAYLLNVKDEQKPVPPAKPVYSEIIAPVGSRIKMVLPDGTKAWLNHGSQLRYPQNFGRDSRNVHLTGEAYFEVEEEKQRPFVVSTSAMEVYATGTCFNVMAYPDEEEVAVSLDEGSVDLYKIRQDQQEKQKICGLVPGEHAVYDRKNNKMNIEEGRNDIHTAWRNGKMIFRGDPLDQIAKRLERWYNVEIVLKSEGLAKHTFTATFSDETLTQILDLLCKAAPLKYEIKPRVKKEDNSFTKRKVVMRLKN